MPPSAQKNARWAYRVLLPDRETGALIHQLAEILNLGLELLNRLARARLAFGRCVDQFPRLRGGENEASGGYEKMKGVK